MKNTAISAIIPTHNRSHMITRAIDSILSQADIDDELIIIDDGSEDETASIVALYGDKIKYIYIPNQGAGVARNIGIKEATRPLVTFLDSDDAWMPQHNKVLKTVMTARPDLLFCFTNYAARFPDNSLRRFALESHHGYEINWDRVVGPSKMASTLFKLPENMPDFRCHESTNLYESLCSNSYVCVSTMIVRRIEAGEHFRFSEGAPTAEEWECAANLARAGKSMYLHYETAWINHHYGNRLTDADMFNYASSRISFRKRIWGADFEFLRNNQNVYDSAIREDRLLRLEGFLLQGRAREARLELADLEGISFTYSLLAFLPGFLAKFLLDVRRAIKSIFK